MFTVQGISNKTLISLTYIDPFM